MKKVILSILLCFSFFLLNSCGEESANLNYETDYKEACAKQDWVKAYSWVQKYREEEVKARIDANSVSRSRVGSKNYHHVVRQRHDLANYYQSKYEEGIRYVAMQECLYIIDNYGANGVLRIIGIAKEHGIENWLFDELLDVAEKMGDEELIQKFKNMSQK